MSNELETIKVKHEDGFMIINKKDFDKEKHELFEKKKKVAKKAPKKKLKKED
jgi:hypothetical protein